MRVLNCALTALGIFEGTGRLPTPIRPNSAGLSAAWKTEGTGRVEGLSEVQCALSSAQNNKDMENNMETSLFFRISDILQHCRAFFSVVDIEKVFVYHSINLNFPLNLEYCCNF